METHFIQVDPTFWKCRIPHQQGNTISEILFFVHNVLRSPSTQARIELAPSADSWPDKAGTQ